MKILCKYHNDATPSMHVYQNGGHVKGFCFVCHASVFLNDEEFEGKGVIKPKAEPTNVIRVLEYIRRLPKKAIRGLDLPYDQTGYFIVWPNGEFYKRRTWGDKTRYIAPAGVKQPLFVYPGKADHLVIVEGEINAMSLHQVLYGEYRICSPGPASEFRRHIQFYKQFKKVTIVADHDAPGVVFGVELRDMLHKLHISSTLMTVLTDFNDTLQKHGEEAVRAQFERG